MRIPIENPKILNGKILNISQGWGENKELYLTNFGINGHNGLDLTYIDETQSLPAGEASYGKPVLSAIDGKVTYLTWDGEHATKGNGIYIENDKFETVYWHLSEILVKLGDEVSAGQQIGKMGNNGFCFPTPPPRYAGTHLHFAVRPKPADFNNGFNGYVDPLPYLELTQNTMRYVLVKDTKEQYLLDDVLKIALNIGDEKELFALFEKGLNKVPQKINSLIGYETYPLIRSSRLRDLFGL